MDSQEQYEALLAKWGFEDTTVEDNARRLKRARRINAVVTFFQRTFNSLKKTSSRPQRLSQAAH